MDTISLVRKLVQIESTNPGKSESQIKEFIINYLEDPNIQIRLDEVEPGRSNIIASISGEVEEPKLIFICHMDTVVVGDGWTKQPFSGEIVDNKIYGRGACDMKAGLACAMNVFKAMALKVKNGEWQLKYPLQLICTVDEEGDMKGADSLVEKGLVSKEDWILDLEPTDGEIQMAHRGRFWIELTVDGVTAHASKPEEGVDAVAGAAEMIRYIRRSVNKMPKSKELGRTTVTFGQIQGGYQPYVVPDHCKVWIDFRLAPPTTREEILELLEEACFYGKMFVPGIRMEYRITGDRPYVETNQESDLLHHLKKAVNEVTGEWKEPVAFPGYTDTAVIAEKTGNGNCLSYGPGNLKYAHKPNEFVEIADIRRCEAVLISLIKETLIKDRRKNSFEDLADNWK